MPSKPETAPYDLIASSDQSISNTLQYTRSLSHTVFWVQSTSSSLYANITAAAIAATSACDPTTLKTGEKEDKIKMACLADWRPKGPARKGQTDDQSVLAAAAALEVVQGVLWGIPKKSAPQESKPQTTQASKPKTTADPNPTAVPKPEDSKPTTKPEQLKSETKKPEVPSPTGAPKTTLLPSTTNTSQLTQTATSIDIPSPTNPGPAQPSVNYEGGATRARFGWVVGVGAVVCVGLMV